MALQYTNYVVPYAVAGVITLVLFARLWRYRDRRAARGFLVDVAGIVLLCVVYSIQLLSTDLGAKQFWWTLRFPAISLMAIGYMLTAIEYTDHGDWLTRGRWAAILAVPVVGQLFVWTNGISGPFYVLEYDAASNLVVPYFGPLYWVWAAALVGYICIGIYLLMQLTRTQPAFGKQAGILVGTITLVMVGEVLWWLHVLPVDPIALTSTVKVVGFLFGVARFELLDIVPVARDKVVDNMQAAVFVVDRTDRIVDANVAGETLTGDENVVRKSIDEAFQEDVVTVARGGDRTGAELTRLVDGETRYYDFQITPLYDDAGGQNGRLFVFRDVTEQKRREEELSILNRIVRHDIRNDMAVIEGHGELLARDLDSDDSNHLEAIQHSTDHVVETTENVRELMTAIAGDGEFDVEPTDLSAVLASEVEQARRLHPDAEIEVRGELPSEIRVQANDMLSSVFTNLLNNAVVHNDETDCRVELDVTVGDSTVSVDVADDGPGIPADQRESIFGRGEKGLDSSGTGVGLYLVDTLVEQYDGAVTVSDNEPRGTVFTVELPLAAPEEPIQGHE